MAIQTWPCTEHPESGPTPGRGRCRECTRLYNQAYRSTRIEAGDPAWYEYRRRTANAYTARLRNSAHAILGDRCACCGIARRVFLSIDHVNNDGASHRRETKNQQQFYRSIVGDPDARSKYQILCHNCNMAKAIEENHTCPEEK